MGQPPLPPLRQGIPATATTAKPNPRKPTIGPETAARHATKDDPENRIIVPEACREAYGRDRSPHLATAELLDRSERNGFAWLEFTMKLYAAGRTAEQRHFSGHLVRDGYWVDLHLSMMPYTPKDRRAFLDFVHAIRIEPKPR
jgi:hypothetical protein